jgi:L-fuconolactonase
MEGVPVEGIIFVEANTRADLTLDEVSLVEELAIADPRIAGIVAYANLLDPRGLARTLDDLSQRPLVRGIRHNIQGNPPGFALQPQFVAGVREAGRRGLTFDLCATHDQLPDVIALAQQVEGTRMVLDHCGKPPIREKGWDPWAAQIRELAAFQHVWCKVSGLLTEADPGSWRRDEVLSYAEHVVSCFGTERVMYGSDWPVLTLANRSSEWYSLTQGLTAEWNDEERRRFYNESARRFYNL